MLASEMEDRGRHTKVSAAAVGGLPDREYALVVHVLSGPAEGTKVQMFPRHTYEGVKVSAAGLANPLAAELPQEVVQAVKVSLQRRLDDASYTPDDTFHWYIHPSDAAAALQRKTSGASAYVDLNVPRWTVPLHSATEPMRVAGLEGLRKLAQVDIARWSSSDVRKMAGVLMRGQQLYAGRFRAPEWAMKTSGRSVHPDAALRLSLRTLGHADEGVNATYEVLKQRAIDGIQKRSSAETTTFLAALDRMEYRAGTQPWRTQGHVHAQVLQHSPRAKTSAAVEQQAGVVLEDNPDFKAPASVDADAVLFDAPEDVIFNEGSTVLTRKQLEHVADKAVDMSWMSALVDGDIDEWKTEFRKDPVAVFKSLPAPSQRIVAPQLMNLYQKA
jgi:hypothetical protein